MKLVCLKHSRAKYCDMARVYDFIHKTGHSTKGTKVFHNSLIIGFLSDSARLKFYVTYLEKLMLDVKFINYADTCCLSIDLDRFNAILSMDSIGLWEKPICSMGKNSSKILYSVIISFFKSYLQWLGYEADSESMFVKVSKRYLRFEFCLADVEMAKEFYNRIYDFCSLVTSVRRRPVPFYISEMVSATKIEKLDGSCFSNGKNILHYLSNEFFDPIIEVVSDNLVKIYGYIAFSL